MLNESLFLSSFDELKNLILHELTILHVALVYVLMYVVYKAFGRYIYFKPQEHASKINRTFLTLSLFAVLLYSIGGITSSLPFASEYRWLFILCGLVILVAPLSIIVDRAIWKYDLGGHKSGRDWTHNYLQISRDYYKINVSQSEQNGIYIKSWEEEKVESTSENLHSDVLLNILALVVFIWVSGQYAYESAADYGYLSYVFSAVTCLIIGGVFLDHAVFSWISYVERKVRLLFRH